MTNTVLTSRQRTGPVRAGRDPTYRPLLDLRRENDALVIKLARLGPAIRGLAEDLADARRKGRAMERQLRSLRLENARLRAGGP